ncbi:MAG: glycoside hydrolase family 3 N-terminal domain-containing protein [Spirochaetales bacterium]|nr:glycoside hydrolase family 3 N-terminal domain-containing protein [Spirochaetales bacterium]
MNTPDYKNSKLPFNTRVKDLISRMTLEEKASQLLFNSPAIERLDIPEYNWWNECLHGIARGGKATVYPQAIGLAATFDRELIQEIASAISEEARAKYHDAVRKGRREQYQGLTFWTPNVNIFRDPRWGRGQETYGEDPYLTAEIGTRFVRGLQQTSGPYMKAAACAKHFAVHSGPEGKRHGFDAIASAHDMAETYLPAFKKLVEEDVESVMGAYNRTNGEVCCGSPTLLKKILREEWGFKGHVVSDCWAIRDFHEEHKVTERPEESVALALNNGCDINCGCTYEYILKAHAEGLITEEQIEESLERALMTRMKLGMFNSPEEDPFYTDSVDSINCREFRSLSRKAAAESFVLLKNNGILPVQREQYKKMLITGPTAADLEALMGNYNGLSGNMTTLLEGLFQEFDDGMQIEYRTGSFLAHTKSNDLDWAAFEAEKSDIIIACMGLTQMIEGEEGDALASSTSGDRMDLRLPESQRVFLEKLLHTGKPVVLLVTGGSPVDLRDYADRCAAMLWLWYPGEEGGLALGDVLSGRISPAGKLPITFPLSTDDLPPFEDYSMKGRTYKYMEKTPQYPFGFGLSYSPCLLDSASASRNSIKEGESLEVSVMVKNRGSYDTDEVVQLYISKEVEGEDLPRQELIDFERISLKAGEEKQMNFSLSPEAFRYFDSRGASSYGKGHCTITAGTASPGKRGEELGASYSGVSVTME